MSDPYIIWQNGVLNGVGAPANNITADVLWAWSGAESGSDRMRINNPLNTTQPEGSGNVDFNSVGVKIYPTVEQGIAATVTTLLNGHYPLIVDHLRRSIPRQQWADCCGELGVWGTGCGWISREYGLPPQLGEDVLTADQSQKLDFIYNLLIQGLLQNPPHDLLAQMQAHFATVEAGVAKIPTTEAPEPAAPATQPAFSDQVAADLHTIADFLRKFGIQ